MLGPNNQIQPRGTCLYKERNVVTTVCSFHVFIPGGTLAGRGIILKYEAGDILSTVILQTDKRPATLGQKGIKKYEVNIFLPYMWRITHGLGI